MTDRLPVSGTLRQPFAEQIAAFRARLGNLVPTSRWDDISGQAHDRAFMVAGATKADLLADLAGAVDKAISEGTGLEAFRRDFREIVERRGWHGWTGEGTKRGEAWRTRVIYRTNMATTYAAGRWAQLMEGGFPLLVYRHGGSREPRPEHLAWDGLTLPVEHEFWASHAPPNGWGCSCYILGARSEAGARRLGGNPDLQLDPGWNRPDPRTGAPAGIDKGWDHAPGRSVSDLINQMAEKAVNWDYSLATAFMRSLPEQNRDALARAYRSQPTTAIETRRWAERVIGTRNGTPLDPRLDTAAQRTLGLLTTEGLRLVEAETGLRLAGQMFDFAIHRDAVRHVMARHGSDAAERARGQRAVRASDFGRLALLLNAPDRVSSGGARAGRAPVMRYERRFGDELHIALFEVRTGRRRLNLVTMWIEDMSARP